MIQDGQLRRIIMIEGCEHGPKALIGDVCTECDKEKKEQELLIQDVDSFLAFQELKLEDAFRREGKQHES